MTDNINHPAHYIAGRDIEPIDVIEDWRLPYHLGNALKYISRAGRKGDATEDIKKAAWYLNRWLEQYCRQYEPETVAFSRDERNEDDNI